MGKAALHGRPQEGLRFQLLGKKTGENKATSNIPKECFWKMAVGGKWIMAPVTIGEYRRAQPADLSDFLLQS